MDGLSRLLRPRSIAVIGGKPAAEVVRQCRRIGFEGDIWPVHPSADSVAGEPAFRSIHDLPAAPDAAFVAVNRHATVEVVGELARVGAGGAVCYAAGFAESDAEGVNLQKRLIDAAGEMPFFGPNCYGFLSYLDGVALWPDQHGGRRAGRGVAIVTQSGNIGLNLTMQQRGLPIGYLVTLGNQATIGLSATIEALLGDERITAIGLHIEGLDDVAHFAEACAAAHERHIPIVVLKTGSSAAGARLTVSHTASLAGADAVADAYFRNVGVARVHSVPVLLETLKLLHFQGPLPGRDIASMSCSGGEAALMADAVERHDLRFGPLEGDRAARIAATLPPLVTISNPLDYHTFSWADEAALTGTFTAMLRAGYDMSLLVLDLPRVDRGDPAAWHVARRALAAAAKVTGGRAGIVATMPETLTETAAEEINADRLVPLLGIDDAFAALAASADVGEYARREMRSRRGRELNLPVRPPPNPPPRSGRGLPSPSPVKRGRGGVGVPRQRTAFARALRRTPTHAEAILWRRLRRHQLGHHFRRQHVIGTYVADFACLGVRLVVEVDGGQHAEGADAARDSWLKDEGWCLLRFSNNEVIDNVEGVLQVISKVLTNGQEPGLSGDTSEPASLSEWEGKRLLAEYGVPVPEGALVKSVAEATAAAQRLGFPLVAKAVGRAIAHKSEIGAVRLGLRDHEAVADATETLLKLGEAVLIERMVPDAVMELIVGVNRDPVFGLHLVIGTGGVLVELLADSRILMIPASREDIAEALHSLKSARLLTGFRGRPAGDIEGAIDAILAIQDFAIDEHETLLELDVNPLMVRPTGAVAVDVLIRFDEETTE